MEEREQELSREVFTIFIFYYYFCRGVKIPEEQSPGPPSPAADWWWWWPVRCWGPQAGARVVIANHLPYERAKRQNWGGWVWNGRSKTLFCRREACGENPGMFTAVLA